MKFEEKEDTQIIIKNYKKTFIYFLLDNNEVVYVGQTKNGIQRPFSHRDKKYDSVSLIYCNEEQLDFLENKYIKKYTPKYNKENNYKYNYSMDRVRNCLERDLKITIYINEIKKIIRFFNIKVELDSYTQKAIISFDDFVKIKEIVKRLIKNNENFFGGNFYYSSKIQDETLKKIYGELYGKQKE